MILSLCVLGVALLYLWFLGDLDKVHFEDDEE